MLHLWGRIMVLTQSSKFGHIWKEFKTSSNGLLPPQNLIPYVMKNFR